MLKSDAIAHYGTTRKLADALGVSMQAVYAWGDDVPEATAYKLEVLTGGALKARVVTCCPTCGQEVKP